MQPTIRHVELTLSKISLFGSNTKPVSLGGCRAARWLDTSAGEWGPLTMLVPCSDSLPSMETDLALISRASVCEDCTQRTSCGMIAVEVFMCLRPKAKASNPPSREYTSFRSMGSVRWSKNYVSIQHDLWACKLQEIQYIYLFHPWLKLGFDRKSCDRCLQLVEGRPTHGQKLVVHYMPVACERGICLEWKRSHKQKHDNRRRRSLPATR